MSCDKYYDLWDPFFYFFEKNWNDCPFPVYLATNSKTYIRKNVTIVNSNHFKTWSEETSIILNKLPFDTIIYLQDDYFIIKKVNNDNIQKKLAKFELLNADYLRLFPSPGPDLEINNEEDIGLISENAAYRTSLQSAIWKKETFIKLLIKDETQWEFEINSKIRSKKFIFLSVTVNKNKHIKKQTFPITYYYLTAVLRGQWRWGAYQLCKKENLTIDTNYRKVESLREKIYQSTYDYLPITGKKIIDYLKNIKKT